MLFLEIYLTYVAWKRGYNVLALLPLGLAVFIGFMLGSSPDVTEDDLFSFWWIDGLAIVVLGVMIALRPK